MEESFLQHAGYKQLKDKYPYFIEQVELAESKTQRILEELEPQRSPTKPVPVKSHYKRTESKDNGIQLSLSADSEGCYQTSGWVKDDAEERQNRIALNDDDDDDETVPKARHDIQALDGRRDMFPREDRDRPEKLTRGMENVSSCLQLTLKLGKLFY